MKENDMLFTFTVTDKQGEIKDIKNYLTLLQIKLPLKKFYFSIVILFSLILVILLNLKFYDTQVYKGIVENDVIYLNVPTDYLDTLINGEFLKIADQKYSFKILSLGEVETDKSTYTYYQMVTLKVAKKFRNNEILTLTVYANQEKIIQKIKKLF